MTAPIDEITSAASEHSVHATFRDGGAGLAHAEALIPGDAGLVHAAESCIGWVIVPSLNEMLAFLEIHSVVLTGAGRAWVGDVCDSICYGG